jgi:hypothetical protein
LSTIIDLAAHGVDGHERAFELLGPSQLIKKIGNGGDLVGLSGTQSGAKVSLAVVAQALSVWRVLSPLRRSRVRRDVLPSMAMNSYQTSHACLATVP